MNQGFAVHAPEPAERHPPAAPVVARATSADVPELAALQSLARGGSAAGWADRIARVLRDHAALVVTARVAGRAVGYANAAHLPEHPVDGAPAGVYLTGVTVAPAWRRRGIAGLLTRRRMDWAWERGPAVWCFVSASNRASLDLHRALGFEIVARGPAFQGIAFDAGDGWLLRADEPPA